MENKIFFIIIGSDQWVISENLRYINEIVIPEGMSAEYIVVPEGEILSQTLENAMLQSDAKYKVYLDQNVFIIDKEFLVKADKIFSEYPDIAMLGSCGFYKKDDQSEMEVKGHYIYMGNDSATSYVKEIGKEEKSGIIEVMALDRHFMMTSVDTFWNGDNANFNIVKSVELRRKKYKTVIFVDDNPTVIFDNGILNE